MRINRIDHLALAVDSIDAALPFFTEVLGLQVTNTDVEEGQGVVVAFLPVGDCEIELIEPVEDSSGVARFLRGRGPGMHHICLEVDDMDAALERLRAHDVRLIDEEPYIGTGGRRIVFIHPKAAHGVLVELYEKLPGGNGNGQGGGRGYFSGRLPGREELRANLEEMRQALVSRGRVMAAGTRGFIDGLRNRR
jgi:methylmalonyl-CoA/ethylmalonyl-CoA epimerase